jgi:hypothetical protein
VDRPLIHVEATDAEDQFVIVYGEEIRHLVAALSEAAGEVWSAVGQRKRSSRFLSASR